MAMPEGMGGQKMEIFPWREDGTIISGAMVSGPIGQFEAGGPAVLYQLR